jgi:hypothetical protein
MASVYMPFLAPQRRITSSLRPILTICEILRILTTTMKTLIFTLTLIGVLLCLEFIYRRSIRRDRHSIAKDASPKAVHKRRGFRGKHASSTPISTAFSHPPASKISAQNGSASSPNKDSPGHFTEGLATIDFLSDSIKSQLRIPQSLDDILAVYGEPQNTHPATIHISRLGDASMLNELVADLDTQCKERGIEPADYDEYPKVGGKVETLKQGIWDWMLQQYHKLEVEIKEAEKAIADWEMTWATESLKECDELEAEIMVLQHMLEPVKNRL